MKVFSFEGLNAPIELPDEYLTVGQIERGYRALVATGAEALNLTDPASGRILAQALLGEGAPDLSELTATPENMKGLFALYEHVGELFNKSMQVGDGVIEEVEEKKEEAEVKPGVKKQSKPRSKSR